MWLVCGSRFRDQGAHSLFKRRKVGVEGYAAHVIDERKVFVDVGCGPVAEEAVQNSLVSSCWADYSEILTSSLLLINIINNSLSN